MSESRSARSESDPTRRAIVTKGRILGVAASGTILILAGLLQPHSTSARGGTDDQPRSEKTVQPSASDSAPKFVAAIRRALKQQEDRLTELADRVFHYEEAFRQARDQLPSQKTRVEEAQATYENAKLIREVAENKVREFRDGQFVGDLAQAEAEIKNAQEEITISREGTKQA